MTLTRYSLAITVFLGFILLSSPVTMTGAFAQQPENKIPSWIKNNAEWWADGSIDESSFIQGIQYLIKENIIDIPTTKQGSNSGSNTVPVWIKNNAEWWADGSIDESSFIQGLQFLIEAGVVQITSTEGQDTKKESKKESKESKKEPKKDSQIVTKKDSQKDTKKESKKESKESKKEPKKESKESKKESKKDPKYNPNDEKNLSKAEKKLKKHERMALEAATDGQVRVIVELDVDFKSKLTKQEKAEKKQTIKNKQKSLKDILSSNGIIESHNLKYSPLIVMTVNLTVLDELISSGLVKAIHEDIALYPSLDTTIPIVGANIAPASDVTGANTVVAILDSGIDNTHDFFTTGGSRIVFEGCYTGSGSDAGVFGCFNGENGTSAAEPCINTACSHGTHVAGIAAGSHGGTNPSSGVASGVDIAAFQVFTVRPNSMTFPNCPANPSCMVAFLGDIVRALDSITVLVIDGCPTLCPTTTPAIDDPLKIVAVNMSFGTKFPENDVDECDGAAVAGVLKGPIDILKTHGVVSIASSGNRGHSNGMGSPACISSVVSVGSSDDFDVIPSYSNSASFLDLVAPGGNALCGAITGTCFNDQGTDDGIRSSIPTGNAFGVNFGTSMAAPHVTGAWALIKSSSEFTLEANYPDPTIAEILHVLKKTGTLLSHPSTALTTPRIQIDLAINAFIHLKDCIVNIESIESIESIDNIIFGTPGDDKIYGTSDNDLIIGLAGNDFINGNEGDDCLFGNLGNDNISGGIGNDYLNGSKGNDNLNGSDGDDVIFGGIGVDHISGGIDDDKLHGGPGDDHISGRAGDDSLFGDDGDDRLDGGADNDILDGGTGDDVILGRGGDDNIDGGEGLETVGDWCIPGDGEDVVVADSCELTS